MSLTTVLDKLDKVRKTGNGQWVACCPAHEDKKPSLGIRELEDGRVLLHCWSGCSVEDILGAIGCTFDDLSPPKDVGDCKRERRPFPATDALRSVAKEAMVVLSSAVTMRVRRLTMAEGKRLELSVERINAALTSCGIEIGKWE